MLASYNMDLAKLSLDGLSVGDAFGQLFFRLPINISLTEFNLSVPNIWPWTDDTDMAIAIVKHIGEYGYVARDILALCFAYRFKKSQWRNYGKGWRHYGRGTASLLWNIDSGMYWKEAAQYSDTRNRQNQT